MSPVRTLNGASLWKGRKYREDILRNEMEKGTKESTKVVCLREFEKSIKI
jgi:hypothetical protein